MLLATTSVNWTLAIIFVGGAFGLRKLLLNASPEVKDAAKAAATKKALGLISRWLS